MMMPLQPAPVLLVLTIAFLFLHPTIAEKATPTYATPSGVHCFKCPAGTYVEEDCEEDLTNSTCQVCPKHQYSVGYNQLTHCEPCKSQCPKHSQQTHDCTPTSNRECVCHNGFHRHPLDHLDPDWKCRPHSQCSDQQGEVYFGNHTHNTACEDCTGNQFVDRSDPEHPQCQDCRICASGSVEVRICSLDGDRECTYSTETEPVTNTTLPFATAESQSLSGGAIAGIVIAVLVVLVVVVVVIIWIVRKKRREHAEHDLEGGTGDATHSLNGNVPTDNGRNHHPSAERVSASEAVELQEVPPGEEEEEDPLLGSAGSDWDEDFIVGKVFPRLANNLGHEWNSFIRQLEGWPKPNTAHITIQHKMEETTFVKNRIYECLMEWRKCCEEGSFTKASIIQALEEVGRNDLREELEKMAASS